MQGRHCRGRLSGGFAGRCGRDFIIELQLRLANGLTWGIRSSGQRSASVVQALGRTASLRPRSTTPDRTLLVHDALSGQEVDEFKATAVYALYEGPGGSIALDMARACAVLAAHTPEALLLHGALVAKHGRAVLLAGPSGRGKSTTSRRLPAPWKALSDDKALVVPSSAGGHAVHPWPTWSRLLYEQSTEAWDVQQSLPLEHIFFLSWSDRDVVESVGRARALCLLNESLLQARGYFPPGFVSAAGRMRYFETATKIVKSMPVSILHISPSGPFWLAIEEALESGQARP